MSSKKPDTLQTLATIACIVLLVFDAGVILGQLFSLLMTHLLGMVLPEMMAISRKISQAQHAFPLQQFALFLSYPALALRITGAIGYLCHRRWSLLPLILGMALELAYVGIMSTQFHLIYQQTMMSAGGEGPPPGAATIMSMVAVAQLWGHFLLTKALPGVVLFLHARARWDELFE